MFFLLKNPHCMEKLRVEVDSVLDEHEVVAPYAKVRHLPYLRACIDESLRMLPPVIFALPRRTPPEGTTVLGEYIPVAPQSACQHTWSTTTNPFSKTTMYTSLSVGWKNLEKHYSRILSHLALGRGCALDGILATLSRQCFWLHWYIGLSLLCRDLSGILSSQRRLIKIRDQCR